MDNKNIRKKVIGGLAWTYAERMAAQFVSLIVTIILARMVLPEEYGVISIVTIFIGIADTFVVGGLGNALIQKKDADQLDFSSVFYFNIVFSIIIYTIIFVLAKPISRFYRMKVLEPVLQIMALRIPVAGINSVQQAYVSKKMEFKKFFFATLGGTVFSAVVGILSAYKGCGVWALVAQYLTNSLIDTVILWKTVRWRPGRMFSAERLKGLLAYGWKILATSLMITIYGDIQDLIIGKKFSSEDLAYSNKGRQFPSLISTNVNTSISKVLFPAIAESQDDLERVKQITRRAISVGSYILSPILIGFAAVADTFVEIVLTSKWMPCVLYLRIMCLVYLLQPIQTASLQAMKALGKSDLYLKLEVIKKVFGIIILLITVFAFHSVLAIIIGSLGAEIVSTVVNIPANKKIFSYQYREQLEDIGASFFMSFIMGCAVIGIGKVKLDTGLIFLLQLFTGGGSYILMSLLCKNKNYFYIWGMGSGYLKKRRERR